MEDFEGNQRYAEYKNFKVDDEKVKLFYLNNNKLAKLDLDVEFPEDDSSSTKQQIILQKLYKFFFPNINKDVDD